MKLRHLILIAVSVILAVPVRASQPLGAKEYAVERKKLGAASLAAVKPSPENYIGKVVEIRGRLSGHSGSGSRVTMIISTAGDGSFLIDTDSLPVDNPGPELACLVRLGDKCVHGLTDLHLVCCTYDAELRRLEETWRRAAAAAAQKAAAPDPKPKAATAATKPKRQVVTADQLVRAYRNAVKCFNPKLTDTQADTIARSILGFSYRYGVDARLVCAVILAESNFRVYATSRCGAMGLGQLMPTTAAGLGVDNAYDPIQNIYGSVRYIKSMLDRMSGGKSWNELTWGELALALAAYNAGPGAVKRHGGIPPYRETQNYVRRVTSIYKQLCGVRG